ncbi:MAG: capsular biosynthesis protein [Campylobacteraceae bacterium]|nr:capsular biosynthesis protein [Campylobacteraceae bacterium]
MNTIGDLNGKRVLFLQGPMGSFFARLDKQMRHEGAITHMIALNAGDWFFANKDHVITYAGSTEAWARFILDVYKRYGIEYLFLFGDCRDYQRVALGVGRELGIKFFVFEEGYVRPDYITMERCGVNHFSKIPRDRHFYEKLSLDEKIEEKLPTRNSYFKMATSAMFYYAIANIFKGYFPYYKHHRDLSVAKEFFYGIRSVYRKVYFTLTEKKYDALFQTTFSQKYYFVPLQVHTDFQVREHSDFEKVKDFITLVMNSFALHASKDTMLVFKHHPMDRGKKVYDDYILSLSRELGIEKRVLSLHDVHLPTCLKHTIATVTINSTVGLSSLYHLVPTLILGKAIYDIEGLTCKGMQLDDFWTMHHKPDEILFKKFRTFLINNTQINSSFYGDLGALKSKVKFLTQ